MAATIPVRRLEFDFSRVPRHWCGGDPRLTHVINALNVIFPEGERFFVRSVRHFEPDVVDPELRDRVRGFYGQEANHGRCHRQTVGMLEDQGYRIADWLAWYHRVAYDGIEPRVPPVVRLSVTVALEHLTATLAEIAFDDGDVLGDADPVMRDLLRWHASEEIEHKSVAFDVLLCVDDRLRVRVVGMGMAVALLTGFLVSGTRHLLDQEPDQPRRGRRRRVLRELARRPALTRAVVDYLRRDFHPEERDNRHLAEAHLASIGRLGG